MGAVRAVVRGDSATLVSNELTKCAWLVVQGHLDGVYKGTVACHHGVEEREELKRNLKQALADAKLDDKRIEWEVKRFQSGADDIAERRGVEIHTGEELADVAAEALRIPISELRRKYKSGGLMTPPVVICEDDVDIDGKIKHTDQTKKVSDCKIL
jgi:ATP-dependent protease HslVU (ClpYQ) ATPase subunit